MLQKENKKRTQHEKIYNLLNSGAVDTCCGSRASKKRKNRQRLYKDKEKENKPDPNPWKATTIEWTDTSSPPLGHGNFKKEPIVYRGPYEYSVPNHEEDFSPQFEKLGDE